MKPVYFFLALMIIVGTLGCKTTESITSAPAATESQDLFTTATEYWSADGDATWTLSDGILEGKGSTGMAVSTQTFADFELIAEFMPDDTVNSGIFVRCPRDKFNPRDGYEINIWDDHANQDFRTGAIVTYGKPLAHVNSKGQWNTYKIRVIGDHIQIWLNDIKTADMVNDGPKDGHVGLQVNNGSIKFRNVRITPYK